MKIIISPDSFKGTLKAVEAAKAIQQGAEKVDNNIITILNPIADGGEGTVETLVESTNGKYKAVVVNDPLMRKIFAQYGILGDGKTAVIEMSAASGITLLKDEEKNPIITSSYGTGELIKDALDNGCTKIIVGLGGSVTNDAGSGMMKALGVKFYDSKDQLTGEGGGDLYKVNRIDLAEIDSRIKDTRFFLAVDVDNPLCGSNGASVVFGPQKGATQKDVEILDKSLENFANQIFNQFGVDIKNVPGSGAAGGMGGGAKFFLNGEIKSGIDLVLEYSDMANKIKNADLIITGEGKLDIQSLGGKAPIGIAKIAKKFKIPVISISGIIEDEEKIIKSSFFHKVYSLSSNEISTEYAIENAAELLSIKAEEVIKEFLGKLKLKLLF